MNVAKKLIHSSDYLSSISERYRSHFDTQKIIISDGLTPSEVISLTLDQGISHVVQTGQADFERDLNTSALMLSSGDEFAGNPISAILDPDKMGNPKDAGLELYRMDFSRAAEKQGLLSGIEGCLQDKKVASSLRSDLMVVADELITNAVYNAPFVDLANTLPGASRDDCNIEMTKGHRAQVFLGASPEKIVVGVRDPYGTLNLSKLFTRVRNCYDKSVAATMNMTGHGGAGIGSFMVFNSSASYYAAVAEGEYTVITSAVPLRMSSRARQELPKNLHLFTKVKEK